MTEKEIMLSGGMYDCLDKELVCGRNRAHVLAQQLNALPADDREGRERITRELLGAVERVPSDLQVRRALWKKRRPWLADEPQFFQEFQCFLVFSGEGRHMPLWPGCCRTPGR